MRVISGRAKGRRLKRVPGDSTRPITDRVKENLFNILGAWVVGTRWLDLFAGTGQVGIEALSRGAAEVVFVDSAQPAIRTIRENLRLTDLDEGATVQRADAFAFLARDPERPFDVVYVAPPQYRGLWSRALALLDATPERWLAPDGQVVVQIHPREFEERAWTALRLADRRAYGSTLLCFYDWESPDAA